MKIFGALALLAAIIIVGYSATSLFMSAYTASAEPWQQVLAGVGTASVVAWEAGALLLIGSAWHRGFKPVAVLSSLLLVVAMLVTMVWEARIVIGGRADKFASREVGVSKLKGIEDDLAWLRKRRETVTSRKDLEWITSRIEQREKDRDAASAVREVMPEASTAALMMGGSEAAWRAFLTALPLLFWMLARVTAVPLAMVAFIGKRQEARTASESSPAVIVHPQPSPAVSEELEAFLKPLESEPEPVTPPEPPKGPKKEPEALPVPVAAAPVLRIVDNTPPKPRSKAERNENVDIITKRWMEAAGAEKSHLTSGMTAKALYASYVEWCRDVRIAPVNDSHFGRSVRRLGVATGKTAMGATYGMRIPKIRSAVA